LTSAAAFDILPERRISIQGVSCGVSSAKSDEPGDCRHSADLPGNFRGACPAPYHAARNRAAEKMLYKGIAKPAGMIKDSGLISGQI